MSDEDVGNTAVEPPAISEAHAGQRRVTSRWRVAGVTSLLVFATIVLSVGCAMLVQRLLLRHAPHQIVTFADYRAEQQQPWFIASQVVSTELVIALPLAMAVGYGMSVLRLRATHRALLWVVVPGVEVVAFIAACLTYPVVSVLVRLVNRGNIVTVTYSVPQIARAFVSLPGICGVMLCCVVVAGLVSVGCAWLFAPWRRLPLVDHVQSLARTLAVGACVFVGALVGWSLLQMALEAIAVAFGRQFFTSLTYFIMAYVLFWVPGPALVAGGYAVIASRSLRSVRVAARRRGIESLSDEDVVFTRERLV